MNDVWIAGVGMTSFGKQPERSIKAMACQAVDEALKDAGLDVSDVDRVYFSNAMAGLITGQEMVRGQVALRDIGLNGIPIVNVENACASGATAAHLGWQGIATGVDDTVLVVGAEKMTHERKEVSFAAIGSATDLENAEQTFSSGDLGEIAKSRSPFMDIYARLAREYLENSDATVRDLAEVGSKNHTNGMLDPRAQYGAPISVEDVLSSRMVSEPLTVYMCAPMSDGAAALVLRSGERTVHGSGRNPVFIQSSVLVSGSAGSDLPSAQTRAAHKAFELAGLGAQDVDVAEVHDATAVAELIAYEELGFAQEGEGATLLRSGTTQRGGRQ